MELYFHMRSPSLLDGFWWTGFYSNPKKSAALRAIRLERKVAARSKITLPTGGLFETLGETGGLVRRGRWGVRGVQRTRLAHAPGQGRTCWESWGEMHQRAIRTEFCSIKAMC